MRISALVCVGLCLASTAAAEDFVPLDAAATKAYRFDLARLYYPDESAWKRELATAEGLAAKVEASRGKVGASGAGLLALFEVSRQLSEALRRLEDYRSLRYAVDTTTEPELTAASTAVAALRARAAFVDAELARLPAERIDALMKEEPRLEPYRFAIAKVTRRAPHTLPTEQEELLSRLAPVLFEWPGQLYQKLIDRTKFGEVQTPAGARNVYRDRIELRMQPDRELRKRAYQELRSEYDANADLFGFTFLKQAAAVQAEAEAHRFKSAFESSLFDDFITPEQVDDFLHTLDAFAPLSRRYHDLRHRRIAAIGGFDDVAPWDSEVVPAGFERPRYTIDDATRILRDALGFHGERYATDLRALLDPANGRIDLVPGEHRVPGAFAMGSYEKPWVFFAGGYHGYLDDVLALAHEGGHAVHYDLISQNGVLPEYSSGPIYFTESFAMLNEFVTADYLAQHARSKAEKIYFLEQLLDVMMARFFDIVMRSEFEIVAFRKIQAGEIVDPDGLHALWRDEGRKYVGDFYDKYPILAPTWTTTPHYFRSPRYYVSYLFANLMAVTYFERHHDDPGFDKRYVDLMVNGFPDTPIRLLQSRLDLDPFQASSVAAVMKVLAARVDELEGLYR